MAEVPWAVFVILLNPAAANIFCILEYDHQLICWYFIQGSGGGNKSAIETENEDFAEILFSFMDTIDLFQVFGDR